MIYVEFDKYGVLNTIDLNEETIFKGNNRVNKIFVYFDGIELKPTHYLTYSALVNENDYDGDLTDLASVRTTYNGKDGYTFYLFSNLTAQAGSLKLSVRLVNRETEEILVSGILPLIVQDTAVSTYSNVNITTTQYNGLLVAIDEVAQTLNEINIEEINGLKDKVDEIETSVRILGTANNNLVNAVENLQEENRNQNDLINKQEKRIHTLELASEGNIIETIEEESTAYEYQITGNTLPYGTIDKLGGMTYKSDNLLNPNTFKIYNATLLDDEFTITSSTTDFYLSGAFNESADHIFLTLSSGKYQLLSTNSNVKITFYGNTNLDSTASSITTLSSESKYWGIRIRSVNGTSLNGQKFKIAIYKTDSVRSEYQPYFEGLRNSAINQVVVKGANLLNPSKFKVFNDTSKIQSDGSFLSKAFTSWQGFDINCLYDNTLKATRSKEGFDFKKGTYYTSVKARIVSGATCNINALVIQRENDNQIACTWINKPSSLTTDYQTYKGSFTLDKNDKIGIGIQVNVDASNSVIQIKDIMIAKADTSYKPYKEIVSTKSISQEIQKIDGYGIGIDGTYYNYVDYENKRFVKKVKKVFSSSNENFKVYATNTDGNVEITIGNVNTDLIYNERYKTIATTNINNALVKGYNNGTAYFVPTQSGNYLLINKSLIPNVDTYSLNSAEQKQYILNTLGVNEITAEYVIVINPLEADLSNRITDDFIIEVEGGGTLVFENEHENAIPFAWTYQEKL